MNLDIIIFAKNVNKLLKQREGERTGGKREKEGKGERGLFEDKTTNFKFS